MPGRVEFDSLKASYPNGSTPDDVLESYDRRWWERAGPIRPDSVYLTGCATTDVTQPYHSLSYLAAALSNATIGVAVRDLGIEFWHYVMSPAVIEQLAYECETRARAATPGERMHLIHLAHRLADRTRFSRAFDQLRDPERFFDLREYLDAVKELNALPRLLTLLSHGSEYRSFGSASPPGYHSSYIDLAEMGEVIRQGLGSPVLDRFYEHHGDRIAAASPVFVGFTVPFLSQLEHTLYLGWLLKQRGVKTVIGGPMAAKVVKYAHDLSDVRALNYAFDFIATGEGESMIVDLTKALIEGRGVDGIRNLVPTSGNVASPRLFFENVNTLPSPDYSIWDYNLYASPVPGALYSPTRGCYWNKCAFCDYGLAVDSPTSPWRMRSPAKVVADLEAARPYVNRFFFAVDVLSPSYAQKLSTAIIEAGQDVHWMADFRLESTFDVASVSIFKEAGCIGAAFGMESADQDTLDSIDKGTDVTRLATVVGAFADVGIPVQLMGFTGFPGETYEQAERTFTTATALLGCAATVALGKFGLSKGSLVARYPENYDVEILYEQPDLPAIPWDLPWKLKKDITPYPADDFSGSFRLLRGFAYPFLGSTSTHHSLLYFEQGPKAPFIIPWWHYNSLLPGPFYVIPYFFTCEVDGEIVLESALTGRLVAVSREIGALLEALFHEGNWWMATAANVKSASTAQLLEFLTTNSLAMFLHAKGAAEGVRAQDDAATEPRPLVGA